MIIQNVLFLIFSAFLKLFFGVIAIGTEQGHIYLVDMRTDDESEQSDEWKPSPIELVSCDKDTIAAQRLGAKKRGAHLAVELGGK